MVVVIRTSWRCRNGDIRLQKRWRGFTGGGVPQRGQSMAIVADRNGGGGGGHTTLKKANNVISTVAKKCSALGLKINFGKSKAVYFNGKTPQVPLQIEPHAIEWTSHHPYLGILIDKELNFKRQVTTMKERITTRLKTMRAITSTEGGANFQVLKLFYVHAIRSIVDYAAPLIASLAPNEMEHLEKLQNQALRIMLGAPGWTKIVNMRAEADLPQINHRVHAMNTSLLAKTLAQPRYSEVARRVQQSLAQDEDLFTKRTWAHTTAQGIKTLQVQAPLLSRTTDAQHPDYEPPPPWQEPLYHFSVTRLTASKASLSADDLTAQLDRHSAPWMMQTLRYISPMDQSILRHTELLLLLCTAITLASSAYQTTHQRCRQN
ncbi:hypothetical protein O3P69_003421 [Scylla paramamosain]|uniref:Reverse transcriptase domain-containing protein n=1 Tax=Scylla paramamosain TaxID=85552 RepID=A0AAW0UHW6_SCYPA